MSGIKYLLDTNYTVGLLKATPEVLELVSRERCWLRNVLLGQSPEWNCWAVQA
jgi:hypothetical protein